MFISTERSNWILRAPRAPIGRLADVYEAVGKYDEALKLLEKEVTDRQAALAVRTEQRAQRAWALMGKREEAIRMLNGLRGANPHELAMVYTALGDYDEAFRLLFGIIEDPSFDVYVKTDPAFDRLHSDPRWQEVLRRMHYPPETATSTPDSR